MNGRTSITRRSYAKLLGGALASLVLAGCSSRDDSSQQTTSEVDSQEAATTSGEVTEQNGASTALPLGKTVVPFNSHEGSGDGGTYDDLRDMCGTTVLDGLAIRGTDVASSLDQVNAWLAGLSE